MSATDCDILIIGAGPAGATAAAQLAMRGHRVTVLEKAAQAGFQRSEWLAPSLDPLLRQLGIAAQVSEAALAITGVELLAGVHAQSSPTPAPNAVPGYLLERERLHDIMVDNARAKGATVIEHCRVTHLQWQQQGRMATVFARHADGEPASWNARFVIDASGRDCILGSQLKSRKRQSTNGSVVLSALFGEQGEQGEHADQIVCAEQIEPEHPQVPSRRMFWFEHGWLWSDRRVDGHFSVSAVLSHAYQKTRKLPLDEFLLATIKLCPALSTQLEGKVMVSSVQADTADTCFSEPTYGACYLLLGDAGAAVHPMFGAGVSLAMHGAVAAADTVDCCLRRPAEAAGALARFDQETQAANRQYAWFSARMDNPAKHGRWKNLPATCGIRQAFLALLVGDRVGAGDSSRSTATLALKAWYYAGTLGDLLQACGLGFSRRKARHAAELPGVVKR